MADHQLYHQQHHGGGGGDQGGGGGAPRKEIYTYNAPWTVFSVAWSRR